MLKYLNVFLMALLVVSCSKKEEKKGLEELIVNTGNGQVVYNVEIAETPEQLMTGLMNRDSLASDSGMIFSIDPARTVSMWMKDTKIPLDMLFVNNEGQIIYIAENTEPMSEKQITTPLPTRAVIEINGGDAKKNNIKEGDVINFKYFDNNAPVVVEEEAVVVEEVAEPADQMTPVAEQPAPAAPAAE